MDIWRNNPLPSYETMIVESLQNVGGTRGAAPKEIFKYMSEHWPLIPNFRPSASQALAKAFKRGRILKKGSLYSLNTAWTSGHSTPDPTQPARHIAKTPASIFSHRSPPPIEPSQDDYTTLEASNAAPISPDTKAIAQAIVSLLRPMIGDIKELETQLHYARRESTDSTIGDGFLHDTTTGIEEPNGHLRASGNHPRPPTLASSQTTPRIIPVDVSDPYITDEVHQNLLRSLESLSVELRTTYTQ